MTGVVFLSDPVLLVKSHAVRNDNTARPPRTEPYRAVRFTARLETVSWLHGSIRDRPTRPDDAGIHWAIISDSTKHKNGLEG